MRVDTRERCQSIFRYSVDRFYNESLYRDSRQIRVSFKVYSLCAFLVKTRYYIPMKYPWKNIRSDSSLFNLFDGQRNSIKRDNNVIEIVLPLLYLYIYILFTAFEIDQRERLIKIIK